MNEIWSRKILWTRRVLELRTREVPRLLTIRPALVRQQIVEQVAEPLRVIGGVFVKRHVEHTVGRGTMVFANGWGGSAQIERKTRCHRRQWSGAWAIIEENRLLLARRDLLDRGTWAATLAINIRHIVTNREGVFRMSPEDRRFDIVDGSGTRDVSHVGGAPLGRPRDRNGLGRGLRGIN